MGIVVGIDEAGRGPLAGPVVAAAVALPAGPLPASLADLDDSKKLDEARREALAPAVRAYALAFGVASVDVDVIDSINILEATKRAWADALAECSAQLKAAGLDSAATGMLLVDGNLPLPGYRGQQLALVKGDGRSWNIAAASILAKTHRDGYMVQQDAVYPGYGFARHKGYGTLAHRRALTQLGPCPIHRRSFKWTPIDG